MTAMSTERLAEIRAWANWRFVLDGDDADDLLAHVDHLTAENARLRGRLDDVRDYAEYRRLYSGICRDILDLLNPPTEGETDHE